MSVLSHVPAAVIRGAIGQRLRSMRGLRGMGRRLLGVAEGLAIRLFDVGHRLLTLQAMVRAAEQAPLLRVFGGLLPLLIPTAGNASLCSNSPSRGAGSCARLPQHADLFPTAKQNQPSARDASQQSESTHPSPIDTGKTSPMAFATSLRRQGHVYRDGIHPLENDCPPSITALLDRLDGSLEVGTRRIRVMEPCIGLPVSQVEDAGSDPFWRRLFTLQERHPYAVA